VRLIQCLAAKLNSSPNVWPAASSSAALESGPALRAGRQLVACGPPPAHLGGSNWGLPARECLWLAAGGRQRNKGEKNGLKWDENLAQLAQ